MAPIERVKLLASPMPDLNVLFRSYRLNSLNLPNLVVMARMTRSVSPGGVPGSVQNVQCVHVDGW